MNVLIVGANGFTGRHILNSLIDKEEYRLFGCSLHDDIQPADGYEFLKIDICHEDQLEAAFKWVKPDVVINTSALSVPDYCETHHGEADEINTMAVEHIAQLCNEYDCRFIHLSTDFVFDGKTDRLYTEIDQPNPVNYYGITKWHGEQAIEKVCQNYAIVRVVVVYGKPLPGQHSNILQLVASKLRKGETIRVVSDQWRTPTYVGDIANGVEQLMHHPNNGIYHICGKDCLSVADIAYRVADLLQLDSSLIQPVTTEVMNEATPRPAFSGLSIEKAKQELGYNPMSLEEGIVKTFME